MVVVSGVLEFSVSPRGDCWIWGVGRVFGDGIFFGGSHASSHVFQFFVRFGEVQFLLRKN